MTKIDRALVYGERPADLLPGLLAFRDSMALESDGSCSASVRLEPGVGEPLIRALMRVEAELLREDSELVGLPGAPRRTSEQRSFDAFVRLACAVGDAADR
jgi:hypothetical protein